MLLHKSLSLDAAQLKTEGDTGKFTGYASVFGGVDTYGDTIIKGAFESTLRTYGKPKMFFNHEWNMPIGKWTTVKEDDHGLYVEGELTKGLALAADVHAAMAHATLDGLSIGGYVKQGDYDETENGRVVRKWSRLMEISPVVFPADNAARIDSVKAEELESAIAEIETIRDFERFLRDAGSFSKGTAAALAVRVKAMFAARGGQEQADTKAMAEIENRLKRLEAFGA